MSWTDGTSNYNETFNGDGVPGFDIGANAYIDLDVLGGYVNGRSE